MTRDPDISPTDLVGGFTIDHFRLIEKIGEDGMGGGAVRSPSYLNRTRGRVSRSAVLFHGIYVPGCTLDAYAARHRTANATVPIVRFVVDADDFDAVDRILEHHLRDNVLGDEFTEATIVREDVPHVEPASQEILLRHTSDVIDLLV
ncbi:MAG: hypothetical protein RBT76_06505 [candidate division Zixibacteria bacterium]|jgi:hypothetical protein|nr:hypothetical protein [candidate division Zixibacteria bacterium]